MVRSNPGQNVSFYIPNNFVDTYKEFEKLAKESSWIAKQNVKNPKRVVSFLLRAMIHFSSLMLKILWAIRVQ